MSFKRGQKSAPGILRSSLRSGKRKKAPRKAHHFRLPFRGAAATILFNFLFLTFVPPAGLLAQPTNIPDYTPQSFQSTDFDPYFNRAEKNDTTSEWELAVSGGLALLESKWELEEDLAIDLLLASVTESDDFNSVDEYREYVRKALELQKQEALNDWMYRAEVLIALEREQFLGTLSGGSIAENESEYPPDGESLNENMNPDADLETLLEDSENDTRRWEKEFEDNLNTGLTDFSTSLVALDKEYQDFKNSLSQADLEFQQNLAVIQNYEAQVRNGIQTSVGSLQTFLSTNEMFADGTGGLNAQGLDLQNLINQISQGLNEGDALSVLVQNMVDYLDLQIQYANQERQTWLDAGTLTNVTYSQVVQNPWAHRTYPNAGVNINNLANTNPPMRQVLDWYASGDIGPVRVYQDSNTAHTVTRVYNIDITATGPYPPPPLGMGYHHTGKKLSESGWGVFGYTLCNLWAAGCVPVAEPEFTITWSWDGLDQNALDNAALWQGYADDLTPVLTTWRDSLLPATQAWETQRARYESDYADWKTKATAQQTIYEVTYHKNKTKVAQERSRWLVAIENEYREGKRSWESYRESLKGRLDESETTDKNEAYYKELVSKSALILRKTLHQTRATSKKLLSSRSSLSSLQKTLPQLQRDFLARHGQNLPDLKTMNELLGQFEHSSQGIMNLALAKAMSAHARETRKQAMEQTADLARQYGFTVSVTDNGQVRATRQIATGNAILKAGWDPTDTNAYIMEESAQNLDFTPTVSASLVKTASLFERWDQAQVQASFETNLNTFKERAQTETRVALVSMDAANQVAETRRKNFQASLETQVANWTMLKDLAQTLLTGGTMNGWVEGQMRSRVAAEIEERTGWPAGFVSGMLGGSSMKDAAKSYMQGAAMQEIERVTGIPGLGGLVFEKFNERQAARNSPTAKLSRTMSKLGTVGAAAMGFIMGGPVGMATAATLAHSQQGHLQKFYYDNPMAMEATAMAVGPQAHTAFKAMRGYYEGGGRGAVASLADSALQITQLVGVSSNVSYSHENGWGGSIGVGAKAFGGTIGVSVSAQEGQGLTNANTGYKNDFMAAGVNYVKGQGLSAYAGATTQDSRYSLGLGYSKDEGASIYAATGKQKLTYSERDGAGVALNAGALNARYSQRGGLSGGINIGLGELTGDPRLKDSNVGITYDRESGWGANMNISSGGASLNASLSEYGGLNGGYGLDLVNPVTVTDFNSLQSHMDAVVTERKKSYLADERRKLVAKQLNVDVAALAGLNDEQIKDILSDVAEKKPGKVKTDNSSRGEGFVDNFLGDIADDLGSIFGDVADKDGWIDSNGEYHERVCFVAGTLVRTRDGYKEIQDIKAGDVVLSWNEKSGELGYNKVAQKFIRRADLVYGITYADGTFVETTWNHPFYVKSRGWVKAKDLGDGDFSLTSASIRGESRALKITSVVVDERVETVYNFEVSRDHTYFVSDAGVLVHNENYDPGAMLSFLKAPHKNPMLLRFKRYKEIESKYGAKGLVEYKQAQKDMDAQVYKMFSVVYENMAMPYYIIKGSGAPEMTEDWLNKALEGKSEAYRAGFMERFQLIEASVNVGAGVGLLFGSTGLLRKLAGKTKQAGKVVSNTPNLNSQTTPKPKGMNNPVTRRAKYIGDEAHRQIKEQLESQGYQVEATIRLEGSQVVRKDGFMIRNNEVVIVKPNTPSGKKSALKRQKLMEKNGYKTKIIYYNPNDPKYLPGSPTYIGPRN